MMFFAVNKCNLDFFKKLFDTVGVICLNNYRSGLYYSTNENGYIP
jgi:hypothetical protein